MTEECLHVVGINNHEDEVDVRSLHNNVTDSNGIELACSRQAGFYNSLAEWIS